MKQGIFRGIWNLVWNLVQERDDGRTSALELPGATSPTSVGKGESPWMGLHPLAPCCRQSKLSAWHQCLCALLSAPIPQRSPPRKGDAPTPGDVEELGGWAGGAGR